MLGRLAIATGLTHYSEAYGDTHITVTDIPSMLPLLEENVELNPTLIDVQSMGLSWGQPLSASASFRVPDIILAADCCYYEPSFPLLLDSLDDLLEYASEGICYFCFKKRRKADLGFVKMAKKRFDVKDGGLEDSRRAIWQRDGIFL